MGGDATAVVLLFPPGAPVLKMCMRLQRRFRCIGVRTIGLSDADATRFCVASPTGSSVIASAWAIELPGARHAFDAFVGPGAPASLRDAFGIKSVSGPYTLEEFGYFSAHQLFFEHPLLPEHVDTLSTSGGGVETETPIPALLTTAAPSGSKLKQPTPAPLTTAAPSGSKLKQDLQKQDRPKQGKTALVVSSALSGGEPKEGKSSQTRKPAAAMPVAATAVSLSQVAASIMAAGPGAFERRPPLVELRICRATGVSASTDGVALTISRLQPLVKLRIGKSAGGVQVDMTKPSAPKATASRSSGGSINTLAAKKSTPVATSAIPSAPAMAAAPTGPTAGCTFKSAAHVSAMQPCLQMTRDQQYTFHFGAAPWYSSTA